MATIDLHCHSCASDGILNPDDLVSSAKSHGVEVLALTDHDTVEGLEIATMRAREEGITLIPGIEFSCEWGGLNLHVLGLNINPKHVDLVAAVANQGAARQQRAEEIDRRLAKKGIPNALLGAEQLAQGSQVGRPHFARYLVDSGHVSTVEAAFKEYLGSGKVGDVKHFWPDLAQVVNWIQSAGGAAVIAHPRRYKLTNTKLRRLLEEFVNCGGDGMEVVCGHQSPQQTDYLADLSLDFGLYGSAGSDFHGPVSRWHKPGAFGTLPARCRPLPL